MGKQKKTWILVRGCQYKPGRSLSLGQLLTKPFELTIPLLPDGPLPIPESAIERTYQTAVKVGTSNTLSGSFKLWAEIDMLPIQGEIGANRSTSKSTSWRIDRIDSEIMVPRLSDVQAAMKREEVLAQINRSFDFKKRLYMITGIRVARGAKLQQEASKTVGGDATVGVDLVTFTGAPVTAGPGVDFSNTKTEKYGFEGSSDFVYAYRVCEIHYRKDVYVKPHNKGDTFGTGGSDSESSDEEGEEVNRLLVEKFESSDYSGAGAKHESFKVAKEEGKAEEGNVEDAKKKENEEGSEEEDSDDDFIVPFAPASVSS